MGTRTTFSCPLKRGLFLREKMESLSMFLYMFIRSPRSRRCSWDESPRVMFLCSGVIFIVLHASFVILFWTFSSLLISPRAVGFQTSTQYSRWGRINNLYMFEINWGDLDLKLLLILFISACALLHDSSTWAWNFRLSAIMMSRSFTCGFFCRGIFPMWLVGSYCLLAQPGLYWIW